MAKTYDNKEDFIEKLMSMTPNDINDFLKRNAKPPKLMQMVEYVDKRSDK